MGKLTRRDGIQCERCNQCGAWCDISLLVYEPPLPKFPFRQIREWCRD